MADIPSNSTNPHELLTCSICEELYDDSSHQAKFLSCFHTFCLECLTKLSHKDHVNHVTIQCPNCRYNTPLPENEVDGLQTNFYITGLWDLSENTETTTTASCHGHNEHPISHFCVTCELSICRKCTKVDHTSKNGHVVICASEVETQYLQELDVSHKSLSQNKENLQLIECEMALLLAAKETAIKEMESYIKLTHEQLEQRRTYLLNDILERCNVQQNALLDRQKDILETIEIIKNSITRSKAIMKTGLLNKLKPINETLRKINESAQSISSSLDLGENYLAFDSTKGLTEYIECLNKFGQTYSKGLLPSTVTFGGTEATAGHQATLAVKIFNHQGETQPIDPGSFYVQVTDPVGTDLHAVVYASGSKCSVTFTPQMSGLHKVSGIFLGQHLIGEQTHIPVSSNNPVLKFGGKGEGSGTFDYPWGIAIDNNNQLYVADVGNKLIQKFTAGGEFLSQFSVAVSSDDHTTCDIALDLDNGLIFCTEMLYQKHSLQNGYKLLVFDLDGELRHTYPLSDSPNPVFIAINKKGDLIMSDIQKKCLVKVDKEGKLLNYIGDFKLPSYVTVGDDDSIIVADRNDDCVYIFDPDGTIRQKIGSSGTGKGQLLQPRGVATDGEMILVTDCGNKHIQMFKSDGTFVSMIESSEDPLAEPRGLAINKDGYVYIGSTTDNCIKKYKYRDIPLQ